MKKFEYKYDELFNPVLQSLHKLGGSGSNGEIEEELIAILNLTKSEIDDIHRENTTKISYRAAWARNYLKRLGLVENSSRGVWALTPKGRDTKLIDKEESKRIVKSLSGIRVREENRVTEYVQESNEIEEFTWEDELIRVMKLLEPDAFERLSQRLLRELGFAEVKVTGKSGDGGIDGIGILKIGGVLSFQVVFQCKKYEKTVGSGAIRDFRGAMMGRADKGLFITTGTFTRDAKLEAKRDGAIPIDLLDGHAVASHLKGLRLGVSVKLREEVTIEEEWFENI